MERTNNLEITLQWNSPTGIVAMYVGQTHRLREIPESLTGSAYEVLTSYMDRGIEAPTNTDPDKLLAEISAELLRQSGGQVFVLLYNTNTWSGRYRRLPFADYARLREQLGDELFRPKNFKSWLAEYKHSLY